MSPTPTPTVTVYDKNGQPYEADLVDGALYRELQRELAEAKANGQNAFIEAGTQLAIVITERDTLRAEKEAIRTESLNALAENVQLRAECERERKEGESLAAQVSAMSQGSDQLRAQVAAMEATISAARSLAYGAPELNMCNYDHEQVRQLNDAMCELFTLLDQARTP
jgi:chromosome segregation ATPase